MLLSLIGPSGSGKSSIGAIVAKKLEWQFLDSDREIERITGLTVAKIFELYGEREFRSQEQEYVRSLIGSTDPNRIILSTGGGLPCYENNWHLLQSLGPSIYLTAPLEVLVTRIADGENRPLLSDFNAASGTSSGTSAGASTGDSAMRSSQETEILQEKLGKLIAERERIYNRARYKIDTSIDEPDKLADEIIRLLALV